MIEGSGKTRARGFAVLLIAAGAWGFVPSSAAGADGRTFTKEALKIRDLARERVYEALSRSRYPVDSEDARRISAASLPADKDDDGMPDAWEKAHGFNPADPDDAWLDADADGVVNLFESQLGSDPRDAATPPIVTVGNYGGEDYTDLADALDNAAPGSCVRVAQGLYKVNYMTFDTKVVMIQGGWGPGFEQRNLKKYPTELDGSNKGEVLYFSSEAGTAAVILDGLKIINGKGSFGAINLLAQDSTFMKTSIFNCQIVKSGCASSLGGGVLHMNNWDTSRSDRTIANTIIGTNQADGIYAQITGSGKTRWRILHSVIAKNMSGNTGNGYGIRAFTGDAGSLKAHVFNSIIWWNRREDVMLTWDDLTFKVDHTDLGVVGAWSGAKCIPGEGNLKVDPKFVASSKADYHLKGTSPLINKGIKKGMPAIDFEGDKRVKGAAPDMGADEVR